jgi:hypothetical protein
MTSRGAVAPRLASRTDLAGRSPESASHHRLPRFSIAEERTGPVASGLPPSPSPRPAPPERRTEALCAAAALSPVAASARRFAHARRLRRHGCSPSRFRLDSLPSCESEAGRPSGLCRGGDSPRESHARRNQMPRRGRSSPSPRTRSCRLNKCKAGAGAIHSCVDAAARGPRDEGPPISAAPELGRLPSPLRLAPRRPGARGLGLVRRK